MATLNAYHLISKRPGMSGRAIKLRQLGPSQLIEVSTTAGKMMSKESSGADYRAAVVSEGIRRSLAGYTAPLSVEQFGKVGDVVWTELTPADFDGDDGKLDKVFTARDYQMIVTLYSLNHDVGNDEIEDIAGKAKAISTS